MRGKILIRQARGWIYRKLPCWNEFLYRKKIIGYERRWDLESEGFTKEGFFKKIQNRFQLKEKPGILIEMSAGDGLVGSLGLWLETAGYNWTIQAWESRPLVLQQLRRNRPLTDVREGRLTDWSGKKREMGPTAITTRAAREASSVCRGIRNRFIRPYWIGIWNPSRCSVWYRRLTSSGYKLSVVWHNIEFYVHKTT